jgi:hypothetical protein
MGEYLGKMFLEIKNRPKYIIKEKYADKVEIITTRSVPYSVYITSYDNVVRNKPTSTTTSKKY